MIMYYPFQNQRFLIYYINEDIIICLNFIIKKVNKNYPTPYQMKSKEISYRSFCSQFKMIRRENSIYLGPHMLMRDTITKRRAVVKSYEYKNQIELQNVLSDYEKLCQVYANCENLCKFIGFSFYQQKNIQSIYLIYDYHQNTLKEELQSMELKNDRLSERSIDRFLVATLNGLLGLQKFGMNYLCLNSNNVIVQGRNTIDQSFYLLFTPYLQGAVALVKQNDNENIQSFNLAEQQLQLLNMQDKFRTQANLSFQQKLKIDKQSLGLMALRLATIGQTKHKIYRMDQNFNLVWDYQELKNKVNKLINSGYSKDLLRKIQYLLFDTSFRSFKQLPPFLTTRIATSSHSSNQKTTSKSIQKKLLFDDSRYVRSPAPFDSKKDHNVSSHLPRGKLSSGKKNVDKSFAQINISGFPKSGYENLKNSKSSTHSQNGTLLQNESPTKAKSQKYDSLKQFLENKILPKISKQHQQFKRTYDGSEYNGMIRNNQKDGYGIIYFEEGDIYGGEWKNDEMQGEGIYLFKNCDLYIGGISLGLKNGNGKYIYSEGNFYEGEWKNDKKDGYGTMYYSADKSQFYQGRWHNGVKEGEGIYKWKKGDRYEGNFAKGVKNGIGIGYKSDGNKISGQWLDDRLSEYATINYNSGSTYEGQVNANDKKLQLNGKGTLVFSDGTNYLGDFSNGRQNGNCRINYSNGDIYQGQIINNLFEGQGTYYYHNLGCFYQGPWKAGKQSGLGQLQFNNGTIIATDWIEGKPNNNKAKIQYANGDRYEGEINKNGKHGEGTYYFANGQYFNGYFNNDILLQTKN